MKDSLRRPILFAVIVITGSILILFDIPIIVMIPIVLIVGFAILLILGAITIAEIKTGLGNLKKKSTPGQKDKAQPVKTAAKQPGKKPDKKTGIGFHITSFVSSIKSLGTLLKERSKRGKKVEDINMMLDKTVSEKVVKSSASASGGNGGGSSVPLPSGGAGGMTKDQDPFLSLSEDEFDMGLLDSLDDQDSPVTTAGITDSPDASIPDTMSLETNEPDIPLPSLDVDDVAGDILKDNAEGLDEFGDLGSIESLDSDFGDLENLSLDDVDLDEDGQEEPGQSPETPDADAPVKAVTITEPGKDEVKTEWIKSDAPKDASQFEDQISTQSDMAAFAGGGGSDADLLSSLASDVKHVKVEKNLSLLRELKDFKAPASDVESELSDMFTRMSAIQKTEKKEVPPKEGTK
ncbi:MAG: hypothetical protein CVV30_04010 [Methanomicrobiales archaeon HGW-Methanomicrobiales-1]|jgi:hypothetical protein|nr:MAG: hypothetical protein CVV30_04010 [Methanomicrobiales archaeon HGW-Methanomicrobiales-1]